MRKLNPCWYLTLLFACNLLVLPVSAVAADKVFDASHLEREPVSLTEYLAVLEDPGQALTLADVQKPDIASRFKVDHAPAQALNFGYTASAYWLRLSLGNTGDHAVERMLEIAYSGHASIQFYQPDATGAYQSVTTGAVLPFATRPYPNHYFVFPLGLPEHSSQVVYLRIQSSPMVIPIQLWSPQAFHAYERNYYIGQAWYFGMAMAMALFNLFLFFALREVIYLQYVGFVTSMAFALAAQKGLIKEFLPIDSYIWSNISTILGYSLTVATALVLTRSMLNTKELLPQFDRLLKILVGLILLSTVAVAMWYEALAKSLALLYLFALTLILGGGVFCALQRQRSAYYFVAAFALTGLGGILLGLRHLGLLPSNVITNNSMQIGSALDMLLLAFALADRFIQIRRKATNDVRQANINLEQRLRERESELAASHERLRKVERQETVAKERQRMMQDMHDGLGSSLRTALLHVEKGRPTDSTVAEVLQGCIDDLKLAIDSMEPVQADLLLLLATWRFRLEPRLEETGITMLWEVSDVPALDWLDPKSALHILRILQEALTNIIKHANATEIRVATVAAGDHVRVTITDNGQGFAVEPALHGVGKGLSNQMRRAEAIDATLKWRSSSIGTTVTLQLPIEKFARTQTN